MKNDINSSKQPLLSQVVDGIVERITYQNEDNGYTIARFIPEGKSVEVTIVGNLVGINVGQALKLTGVWTTHPQYGRQFEVRAYEIHYPATVEGLRKYLGSGLIRGIGPVNAGRIVDSFGIEALEIIDHDSGRLLEVPGIGEKRAGMIAQAWKDQKQIKEIMIFLQGHGVSTSLCVKIYKQYGDQAIEIVRANPYRLARDIYGIGFKTADSIARQVGLAPDDPNRIQAGILYALSNLADDGHCFAIHDYLIQEAAQLLELPREQVTLQVETLVLNQEMIQEDLAIYLPPFFQSETGTAAKLIRILKSNLDRLSQLKNTPWKLDAVRLPGIEDIQLTDQQASAVKTALEQKVSILTGGPGTGKSTIIGSLVQFLVSHRYSVMLAAPTGRAAKRMSQATGIEAKTIHRLLEFSPGRTKPFLRDVTNPLDADMVVIDETSMVDILLMNHLLSAVDNGSHLLLVGDADQLPSVGPGNVLRDLIDCNVFPVTRLNAIFRQAQDSQIIINAHRINRGQLPAFPKEATDFYLFAENDPDKAADWVIDLVGQRIPGKFNYDPRQDIQVLCPMHRGPAGVEILNQRLQETLNPPRASKSELRQGFRQLREGDRVMQIVNNYDRQVFNGDMGSVQKIDLEDQVVEIAFDDRLVKYDFSDLNEITHSYAISIHKAQGSEFPVVVIPLLNQHYMMLQRNLLYTAVTRARKMVVLVGSRQAIAMAVKNNRIIQRNTRLKERLIENAPPPMC